MSRDHCLDLDDREARAVLAGATVLVRPVTPPLPADARPWTRLERKGREKHGSWFCWVVGEVPDPQHWRQCPVVPGDVAVLRERWILGLSRSMLSADELLVEYVVDGMTRSVKVPWLVWVRTSRRIHGVAQAPQTMPAALARHRRKVVSVEPVKVAEIPWQDWLEAGFTAGGVGEAEILACEEWSRRYGAKHPWETAWGWVVGMEG